MQISIIEEKYHVEYNRYNIYMILIYKPRHAHRIINYIFKARAINESCLLKI